MDDDSHKIVPIRPKKEMIDVFVSNAKIVNPQARERIECRRYDLGFCRECEKERGKETPWCQDHYPWDSGEWEKLR